MPKETMKYSNDEITVLWKPKSCIHSTLCWKGLIEVFNPKARPWIKMDGASTQQIMEQVSKCPSGALSYSLLTATTNASAEEPVKETGEAVKPVTVEVSQNGPYLIKSECLIVHSDGREETKTGTVALCRCGGSNNKPYCDGQHKKTGFEG